VTATGTSDRKLGIGLAAVGRPAYTTTGRAENFGAARDVATFRDRAFAVLDAAQRRTPRSTTWSWLQVG
jgi:hypothetical protein